MLQEVRTEIAQLGCNFTFAKNLSLTMVVSTLTLCGLAELQSQNTLLSEQTSITNISNSSSTKVIVDRK